MAPEARESLHPTEVADASESHVSDALPDLSLQQASPAPAAGLACPSDKAALINEQVDYYFSAENLQGDTYLKKMMKGSKNRSFPLKTIANFKKMLKFHPIEHIYDALSQSKSVNVFVDGQAERCVQRKEPFHQVPKTASAAGPKKAKAKAASGYEQYYADPPVTPQVAIEEQELYGSERSVVERLETAVRRYKSRRKMDSFVANVFQKWMAFGGIHVGGSLFQSAPDPAELEEMSTAEKKEAKTQVDAFGGESDDHGIALWDVDFANLAKAFLSRRAPEILDIESPGASDKVINVMLNFYRYLQQHDVCPEYNEDIQIAKSICQAAQVELPKISTLYRELPGVFNVAASTIFGGQFAALCVNGEAWADEGNDFDSETVWKTTRSGFGFTQKDARRYFTIAALALGMGAGALKQPVVKIYEAAGMEVERMCPPGPGMVSFFSSEMRALYGDSASAARPLGMLICRPWKVPAFAGSDLPSGVSESELPANHKFQLLVEEDLLEKCFVGMKLQATVQQLQSGLQFFDSIVEIRPTFDIQICNELVLGHKEVLWYEDNEVKSDEEGKSADSEEVYSD